MGRRLKILGLGMITFCASAIFGQEIYFSAPQPDEADHNFSQSQQATYKDESGANQLIVTSNRIISRNYQVHSISKETVRESSQYQVRGEYLHGFYKNGDSCKVLLEEDTYFFVQKDMQDLVGGTAPKNYVKISDKEYVIFHNIAPGKYRLAYLEFKGSKIIEYEIDLDKRETILTINKKSESGKSIILSPSIFELKDLIKKSCFKEAVIYKR